MDNDLAFLQSLKAGEGEHQDRLLQILQHSDQIPYLQHNSSSKNNNASMVFRYRGMVQDMMNPEYYQTETSQFRERQPLVLIPIPFSNKINMQSASQQHKKREREESVEEDQSSLKKQQQLESPSTTRDWKDNDVEMTKKSDWWHAGCMGSHPDDIPILAQFYDENNEDGDDNGTKLKLNDIVELIGILDSPVVKEGQEEQPHEEMNEILFDDEITQQLPCIHVLYHRTMSLKDCLKKKNNNILPDYTLENTPTCPAVAEALRLTLFSQAERKHCGTPIRTPMETTLGCASLNVILPTEESCWTLAHQWQSYLQQIVPVVGVLATKQITSPPTKEKGQMVLSPLQLPKGSMLIIVDDGGGHPFLASLTQRHSMSYEFEGGISYAFEADYRLVVLSVQTPSSVLPCTLSMVNNNPTESLSMPGISKLYQALLQSPGSIALGKEVLEEAQQDFMTRRQEARRLGYKVVEEDDFHRWLTLTRLQARSEGHEHATIEDWKNALRVDDLMKGV